MSATRECGDAGARLTFDPIINDSITLNRAFTYAQDCSMNHAASIEQYTVMSSGLKSGIMFSLLGVLMHESSQHRK